MRPAMRKPGDLRTEGYAPAGRRGAVPDQFEMVVNRKTATALGLVIPPSILLRADEVIE
jgi:putative ABC transport system substrate-binding protein